MLLRVRRRLLRRELLRLRAFLSRWLGIGGQKGASTVAKGAASAVGRSGIGAAGKLVLPGGMPGEDFPYKYYSFEDIKEELMKAAQKEAAKVSDKTAETIKED